MFVTFVYGDPVVEYREHVWDRLTGMSLTRNGLWLMLGDFNDITGHHEKKGGRRRHDTSFIPFKSMLANCGMIDFPAKGNPLSWVGNRSSGKVQCKLDRAVGNEDWHHIFSHTNVEYLRLWGSDHLPILTCFLSKQGRIRRSKEGSDAVSSLTNGGLVSMALEKRSYRDETTPAICTRPICMSG